MMIYKFILLTLSCFALINLINCDDDNFKVDEKCASSEKCVDDKLHEIVEKIDNTETISLIGDLEIVKLPSNEENVTKANGRNADWWDWIQKYIQTHALRYTKTHESRNDFEEGRTKKLKKFLIPLLVILKLKLALILPTILSAITLLAIKGIFAGVVAIIISGMTALKSLGEGKKDRITAIVAPIPADILKHHSDYGNRWSRLGQEGPGSLQGMVPQSVGPTSNILTQAYAPDPSLDPYNAYSPYPTVINSN